MATPLTDAARPDPVSVVLAPGRAEVRLAGDIDVTVAVREACAEPAADGLPMGSSADKRESSMLSDK